MDATVKRQLDENTISRIILDCAYRVHTKLGTGLLESTYRVCLAHELIKAGLRVRQEVSWPVEYDGIKLDAGYRIDILVEECVILELKCVDKLAAVHTAQVLSYLKLSKMRLGIILNFYTAHLREGIKRVVNRL